MIIGQQNLGLLKRPGLGSAVDFYRFPCQGRLRLLEYQTSVSSNTDLDIHAVHVATQHVRDDNCFYGYHGLAYKAALQYMKSSTTA